MKFDSLIVKTLVKLKTQYLVLTFAFSRSFLLNPLDWVCFSHWTFQSLNRHVVMGPRLHWFASANWLYHNIMACSSRVVYGPIFWYSLLVPLLNRISEGGPLSFAFHFLVHEPQGGIVTGSPTTTWLPVLLLLRIFLTIAVKPRRSRSLSCFRPLRQLPSFYDCTVDLWLDPLLQVCICY